MSEGKGREHKSEKKKRSSSLMSSRNGYGCNWKVHKLDEPTVGMRCVRVLKDLLDILI